MATALKQDIDKNGGPNSAPETPKGGKRKFVLPIVLLLAAYGAFWAFKTWSYGRVHESTDNAAVDGHLVPVLAKANGYVVKVNVADNDHVKAESLLVRIDPAEYKVKLAQADADLAAARATAGGAGSNGQAQAAVEQATGQRSSLDAQIRAQGAETRRGGSGAHGARRQTVCQCGSMPRHGGGGVGASSRCSGNEGGDGPITGAEAACVSPRRASGGAGGARQRALQLELHEWLRRRRGSCRASRSSPDSCSAGQPLAPIVSDTGVRTAN